jgi:hypothetical protein
VGDLIWRVVLALVDVVGVLVFGGLIGVMREEVVAVGRLGGAEDVAPKVVRRPFSVAVSERVERVLLDAPKAVVREEGRLFSSPSVVVVVGLRVEDVVGRVGGLEMVLPDVREVNVLVRVGVEADVSVLLPALRRDVVETGFFASSDPGRPARPVAVVRRSMVDVHVQTWLSIGIIVNWRNAYLHCGYNRCELYSLRICLVVWRALPSGNLTRDDALAWRDLDASHEYRSPYSQNLGI